MINDKVTRYSGFYLLITQTAHTFLIRPLIYGSLLRERMSSCEPRGDAGDPGAPEPGRASETSRPPNTTLGLATSLSPAPRRSRSSTLACPPGLLPRRASSRHVRRAPSPSTRSLSHRRSPPPVTAFSSSPSKTSALRYPLR
jgi:hypothetical protein